MMMRRSQLLLGRGQVGRGVGPRAASERAVSKQYSLQRPAVGFLSHSSQEEGWSTGTTPTTRTTIRNNSSASGKQEGQKDDEAAVATTQSSSSPSSPTAFSSLENSWMGTTTRGIGQVIFLNSPLSGLVVWSGLFVADPALAQLGFLGALSATATARQVSVVVVETTSTSTKEENDTTTAFDHPTLAAWKDGLYGYNGFLVGCAASYGFLLGPQLSSSLPACVTATVVGAAATPLVQKGLGNYICTASPQWTYAFNIVTLSTLGFMTSAWMTTKLPTSAAAATAAVASTSLDATTTTDATTALVTTSPELVELLSTPLIGMSQIFLVESALSGALILAGTALYSPGLAAHALLGSSVGSGIGALWVGADGMAQVTAGLWGYNAALSSMAVGVFFVHSPATMALSAGSAATTALVFGGTTSALSMVGCDLPCLTVPFCVTMSAVYTMLKKSSMVEFAHAPHSPEVNTAK
jgi:urea transporter